VGQDSYNGNAEKAVPNVDEDDAPNSPTSHRAPSPMNIYEDNAPHSSSSRRPLSAMNVDEGDGGDNAGVQHSPRASHKRSHIHDPSDEENIPPLRASHKHSHIQDPSDEEIIQPSSFASRKRTHLSDEENIQPSMKVSRKKAKSKVDSYFFSTYYRHFSSLSICSGSSKRSFHGGGMYIYTQICHVYKSSTNI